MITADEARRELARRELERRQSQIQPSNDFSSRVKADYQNRLGELKQTESDILSGKLSGITGRFQGAVQAAGKTAGLAFDVIGEGLISAGHGLSFITPDVVEKPVVEGFKNVINWISNSQAGKEAANAISEGADAWQRFKNNNPQEAKTVESAVNLGLLLAPVKTKAKASPLEPIEKKIGDVATKQIAKNRGKFVQDFVLPKPTVKTKLAETSRTTEKGWGPFRKSIVEPSAREKEIATEVYKIKAVSHKNSIQMNMNVISDENVKLARQLESHVAKSKVNIPLTESSNAIDSAISTLVSENPTIVGNAERTAQRIGQKAKDIIDKNGTSGSGLLRSRKELDNWIRSQKGQKAFDPEMENALSVSVKAVRTAMNDLLDSKVKNSVVKRELKRQSLLYDALESLGPKAAEEANTAIARAWQNAVKVLPFKNKLVQELGFLTGIGGLGAAAKFAPLLTATIGAAAVGRGAYKLVMTPQAKIMVGKIVKLIDKAVISSKNPSMIRQLRADRALLLELNNNASIEEQK